MSVDVQITDIAGFPEEGHERVAIREVDELKVTVWESLLARRVSIWIEKNAREERLCS